MTDLYRSTEGESTRRPGRLERATSDRTRLLLWVALVVATVLNAVLSNVNVVVGAAFGVVVLACAWALIVRHRRSR